jgi:hypothetical protein
MIRFIQFFSFLLIIVFFSVKAYSQDQIILRNDSVIDCKITDINTEYVTLKIDNQFSNRIFWQSIKDFKVSQENSGFQYLKDTLAQQQPIRFVRKGFSTRLYLDDKKLISNEAKSLLFRNKDVFNAYKNGKGIQVTGTVIASLGGIATVWTFFSFFGPDGGEIIPLAISAGAAMIGVAIFYAGANKQERAIDQYNSELQPKVSNNVLKLGATPYGFGIVYQF